MEELLAELTQLLMGIAIMQVRPEVCMSLTTILSLASVHIVTIHIVSTWSEQI